MVKFHCDRCGKEIKDKYYTINMNEYDVNPKYDYGITSCASALSNVSRDSILVVLNNTKMYCDECKDKIKAFIKNV
jgi:hypothetical protein